MSIAFEWNGGGGNSIRPSGFAACVRILGREEDDFEDYDFSSSLGQISDVSGGDSSEENCREDEFQSSHKGPLDASEEVLPVSISSSILKFYNGKSRSFTSLVDASSASSIKDFTKPENTYTWKWRNLLASSSFWHQTDSFPAVDIEIGIVERPKNPNRSTLDLGLTRKCTKGNNCSQGSYSISLSSCLPHLYPHGKKSPGNGSCLQPPQQN